MQGIGAGSIRNIPLCLNIFLLILIVVLYEYI